MDVPTYIVIAAFLVSGVVVGLVKVLRVPATRARTIILSSIALVWIVITMFGELVYFWAGNATCSPYLGCVAGFAGFDAFEHLFFGITLTLFIVWLCDRFPTYSILQDARWKQVLTIIAIVALVSVAWEMAECAHDAIRLDMLHEPLLNFKLHVNLLDQPTNLDTMGDLTFAIVGGIIGLFI